MSLTENLLASIQAELDVLKSTETQPAAETVVVAPVEPVISIPAPVAEDNANVPPVIKFAREEAKRLQGK
jgi:hypothetical protein